jgi:hypothetical protein
VVSKEEEEKKKGEKLRGGVKKGGFFFVTENLLRAWVPCYSVASQVTGDGAWTFNLPELSPPMAEIGYSCP